tara:strand:- start:2437 stop:2664 length:228 start_codon:yes stop_codon:yes gene_type:complete
VRLFIDGISRRYGGEALKIREFIAVGKGRCFVNLTVRCWQSGLSGSSLLVGAVALEPWRAIAVPANWFKIRSCGS